LIGDDEMAKASVIEARKAQAAQDQANATAQLGDQVAKLEAKVDGLEAKIDALIEALNSKTTKSGKGA